MSTTAAAGKLASLLDCQRRVLEHIATGTPLPEILATLVALVEDQIAGLRCALLLADAEQTRLSFVAAPHIPEDYRQNITPWLEIGPRNGSCGTAAFRREPVYTRDTANDPLWADCGEIAVRNGLRAIWSTPILGDDNTVLGTFAIYYGEPRLPDREHIELIDMATQMARVAIEARRAEAALRESENRFRQIAENIREVFWMSTPGLDEMLYVSPAYERIWGRSIESLRRDPRSFLEAVVPQDRERALKAILNERKIGFDVLYRIVRPDGTLRWIRDRGFPVKNDAGDVHRIVGVAEDVSERQALSEQREELLRLVINTIPTTAWSLRPDGAVDFVNQRYLEYTGLSLEAALVDPTGVIHPEDKMRVMQEWLADVAAGQAFEGEMRLRRADGEYRWFLVRTVPLRDAQGDIVKWYGASTDIEDRKRAEQASRDAAAELQALSRRLVELQESERRALARELHDRLGETLTALSINLGMLNRRGDSAGRAARVKDSLALVKAAAAAIENIAGDLRPPMLDDHGLAAALEWYGKQFSQRVGVAVSVQAERDTRLAPEVETALFRIAQEALNNVAKHARARNVAITLWRAASDVVMSIADDGIGLAATRPGERSGLGLVTMRERAQAIGGRFVVEPVSEGGTRLTVKVPL